MLRLKFCTPFLSATIFCAALPAFAEEPLPPPAMERRSTPAMVSGIVLTSAAGLSIFYLGFAAMGDCGANCERNANVTRGTLIGGAVALAVGIPLLIYGAKRVPADSSRGSSMPLPKWAGAPSATGWGWTL
jgi:hypothetical protein